MISFFQTIQDSLFGTAGNSYLVALGILAFFVIAFLIIGLDFRYALLIPAPLVLAFVSLGWFPQWVGVMFWFLVITLGGFIMWNLIKDRY